MVKVTTIKLDFPKSETSLAGFPYGENVYQNQVKGKISFDGDITIVFPNQIEKVASSFVQGFFANIVTAIGYKGIEKKVNIMSKDEKLTSSIRKNIY